MSLLDGGLRSLFGSAFSSIYLPGTLHQATRVDDAGGTPSISYSNVAIRGQVDTVTSGMIAAEGYSDKDVALIVLQAGLTEAGVRPTTDSEVTIGGRRYKVRSIVTDPANTHWIMRGSPA